MKPAVAGILLALSSTLAFAQPDPRDSVILESKSVAPGFHPGVWSDTGAYFYLKVYITNKDTLTALVLAIEIRSLTGGAYATTAWPRNFNGGMSRLTSTLSGSLIFSYGRNNSNSPDSLLIAEVYDPLNQATLELPNLVRKPIWEVKFDTVRNNPGTFQVDTVLYAQRTGFTNTAPRDLPVNFVKAVITVMPKGDLDLDGQVNLADVVWMLNCIFQGLPSTPAAYGCDLDCNRERRPADLVWEIYKVFLGRQFPC